MSRKKRSSPITKPWIHLTDVEKPFDQTNGVVDFDVEDKWDASDPEADILAKGVASNTVNAGFFGGGLG
jgi:hypothetical protein